MYETNGLDIGMPIKRLPRSESCHCRASNGVCAHCQLNGRLLLVRVGLSWDDFIVSRVSAISTESPRRVRLDNDPRWLFLPDLDGDNPRALAVNPKKAWVTGRAAPVAYENFTDRHLRHLKARLQNQRARNNFAAVAYQALHDEERRRRHLPPREAAERPRLTSADLRSGPDTQFLCVDSEQVVHHVSISDATLFRVDRIPIPSGYFHLDNNQFEEEEEEGQGYVLVDLLEAAPDLRCGGVLKPWDRLSGLSLDLLAKGHLLPSSPATSRLVAHANMEMYHRRHSKRLRGEVGT